MAFNSSHPTFCLANLLTFYLAYLLTFCLADLLTFYLAYLLTFYLAYLLTFYLAYLLAFCLSYLLTFYLAYLLTFYLAYLLTFYLAFYLYSLWHSLWLCFWPLRSGWGPARPTARRISPVEVRRGPQCSGEAHSAPNRAGRPTILRLWVRRGPLRSRAGSGGPATATAMKTWQWRPGEAHCDQELAERGGPARKQGGGRRSRRKEGGKNIRVSISIDE